MRCLFDLRLVDHSATDLASLTTDGGLSTEPALMGSAEWWELVGTALPVLTTTGVVSDVVWASMGDFPMFDLQTDDGRTHGFERKGDIRRYVVGLPVEVRQTRHPWKQDQHGLVDEAAVTLSIHVEESDRRSPAFAPGPGGHGYRLDRRRGDRFHRAALPDVMAVERLRERSGQEPLPAWFADARIGREEHHASVAVRVGSALWDARAARDVVEACGGRYEGYDELPNGLAGGEPLAVGPRAALSDAS